MVFNAVTKDAVQEAMRHPREIDEALVDAYRARRALDYLVGFTLSPVLWRKLPGARSAGRVQSVALRIVCDRELEIERFVAREYWSIVAHLRTEAKAPFTARLVGADGKKISRLDIGSGAEAEAFKIALEQALFSVAAIESKPVKRHPYPPFTTSTLQQEASRKLGLAPARTMQIAQRLYEGVDVGDGAAGLITYMRTDGVDLAPEAVAAARRVIAKDFGDAYVPSAPRKYTAKAKNAQEAHEAIRPTEMTRRPHDVARHLEPEQAKLYELIWTRTIACQMESAELERTTVDILAEAGARKLEFRASGQVVRFPGFLALYQEGRDDEEDEESGRLPAMRQGEKLAKERIEASQHFTEPPPRYTEATLVKRMEELGIGRPSTYASTIAVLKDRDYVRLDKKRLFPEDKGRLVTAFLESFFAKYVGYDFTADLEEKLDQVSNSEIDWKALLRDFWNDFSGAVGDIKDLRHPAGARQPQRASGAAYFSRSRRRRRSAPLPALRQGAIVAEARQIRRLHRLLALSRMQVLTRSGADRRRERRGRPARRARARSGPGDRRRDHSAQRALRRLRAAGRGRKAQALVAAAGPQRRRPDARKGDRAACAAARGRAPSDERRADPRRHRPLRRLCAARQDLRQSRAATTTCSRSAPTGRSTSSSPRRAARAARASAAGRGRVLGEHPEGGAVSVKQGRFGAYVNHGKINATLPKGTDPASLTLDEAVELLKAKAAGGGVIGRLVGQHPDGGPVTVRDGRFGAYVNWGKVNATIPKGTAPDSVTLAQALELLAEREGKPAARPPKSAKAPARGKTQPAKPPAKTVAADSGKARAKPAAPKRPAARKAAATKPKSAASGKRR